MITMFCKNFLVLSLTAASLIMMGCQKGSSGAQDASTSLSREFSSLSENVSATDAFVIPGDFEIPGDKQSCSFNNQEVLDGGSVTAYINSTVAFGGSCQSETRTCTNGVLSGSSQYATCAVDAPASCLFNGETISHGQSLTAYLNSNVAFGGSCQSETRTCENGSLSGSSQYASCEVAAPASCLFNGQTIAHGQSAVAFATSTVGFGELCQQESRTCTNGALSGSSQYASCEVAAPASCLFNGQTIAHGQNVMGYLAPSVDAGSTCKQETRTCENGSLSGSYFFSSCVVEEQVPTPLPEVTDPTTPPASSTPPTSSTPTVSETQIPTDEPTPTTSSTPSVSQPTTPPVITPPVTTTSSTPIVSQPTTPPVVTPPVITPPVVTPPVVTPDDPNECPTYKKDHFDCRKCKPGQHDCRHCMKDHKESTSKENYGQNKKDCKKPKKEKCKDKHEVKDKDDCKDKKKDCDKSKDQKKEKCKKSKKDCDKEKKSKPCNLQH